MLYLRIFMFLACVDSYKGINYGYGDSEQFLNYGHKKLKDDRHENSVLKSKVEVLGGILKKHVELLRSTPNQRIELVFLVDSSASVGSENFFNELKFVKKLLADFTVSYDTTRVSVVTFSSKNRVVRHIDHITNASLNNHKCKLLEEEIPAIGYTGGGTYTLGAVLEAQKILNFARPDAKKAVFLITDGYSNGGDPRFAARRLREEAVEMFTFGIRNGNVRELFDMASEPQHEHSYIVDSFEEFEALARRALHEDLPSGGYLNQDRHLCLNICTGTKFDKSVLSSCCDSNAHCACGTHSGLYACLCRPGYFGTGLFGDCHECPSGTYKNVSGPGDMNSCTPCPSKNHISPTGATSVDQCTCKPGYFLEKNSCRGMFKL
ncbi:hypothetical protein QYM36_001622 [Artemia franciscana]|uniref:VWFA domain-containing protein n=1 Tax=Artemia franciscana TaxID=6661 RepID=A0AA88LKF9_ARTSF|nr:hypothetical protein QYM36_001622 [Artemia franciscana]